MQNLSFQKIILVRALSALTLLTGSSCATSQKGKISEWAIIGGSAGFVFGSTRPDYQDKNAMMFSAIGTAIGALAGLYYFDPDKQSEKLAFENQKMKKDMELIQASKVIVETPATFNTKIPAKYKQLINPGEWRISEIDQWIEEGENRLIHQDKIMELIPPTLKPVTGYMDNFKTEKD